MQYAQTASLSICLASYLVPGRGAYESRLLVDEAFRTLIAVAVERFRENTMKNGSILYDFFLRTDRVRDRSFSEQYSPRRNREMARAQEISGDGGRRYICAAKLEVECLGAARTTATANI